MKIHGNQTFKQVRMEIGYSQAKVGGLLGVSRGTIQRIEMGDTPPIYLLAMEAIRLRHMMVSGLPLLVGDTVYTKVTRG